MQLSLASRSNGVSHVDWRGRITQRDLSPFSDPLADLLGADAFGKPVLLPASVGVYTERVVDGWDLSMRNLKKGYPHLTATVRGR